MLLEIIANAIVDSALTQWVQSAYWLWPVLEILHFIGLSLLFGGLLIVDLRMAGLFRALSPRQTHGFLPLVLVGFGINLVTGILFFFGDPMRYAVNIGFQVKMVLVVIAGMNALAYHWKIRPLVQGWEDSGEPPLVARSVAWLSLLAWTGVLLSGRLIPYVGTG